MYRANANAVASLNGNNGSRCPKPKQINCKLCKGSSLAAAWAGNLFPGSTKLVMRVWLPVAKASRSATVPSALSWHAIRVNDSSPQRAEKCSADERGSSSSVRLRCFIEERLEMCVLMSGGYLLKWKCMAVMH